MKYLRAVAMFGEVVEAADNTLLDVEASVPRVLTGSAP
jgi:hypothetical protein